MVLNVKVHASTISHDHQLSVGHPFRSLLRRQAAATRLCLWIFADAGLPSQYNRKEQAAIIGQTRSACELVGEPDGELPEAEDAVLGAALAAPAKHIKFRMFHHVPVLEVNQLAFAFTFASVCSGGAAHGGATR